MEDTTNNSDLTPGSKSIATVEFENLLYKSVTVTLNATSIILALSVFVAALFIHGISKGKTNKKRRLSFRLVMAIAFSDACFSASQIHGLFLSPGFFCTFSTWAFMFFLLLTQFLTSCIALNLFLVLVLEKTLPSYTEYIYFGSSIVSAFIITILPVIFGVVGYDQIADSCWFIDQESVSTVIWEMCSLYGWGFLSVIFCFSATYFIVFKLRTRFNSDRLNGRSGRSNGRSKLSTAKLQKRLISRTVGRIALYPLIPSISLLFNLSNLIYILVNKSNPFPFALAGTVFYSSHGIVTAILFLFDPTVSAAITSRKFSLISQHFPNLAKNIGSTTNSTNSLAKALSTDERRSTIQFGSNSSQSGSSQNFPMFSSIWLTYNLVLTKEQRAAVVSNELSSCRLGDEYFMEKPSDILLEANKTNQKTSIETSCVPYSGSECIATFDLRRLSNEVAIPIEHMKKFIKSL